MLCANIGIACVAVVALLVSINVLCEPKIEISSSALTDLFSRWAIRLKSGGLLRTRDKIPNVEPEKWSLPARIQRADVTKKLHYYNWILDAWSKGSWLQDVERAAGKQYSWIPHPIAPDDAETYFWQPQEEPGVPPLAHFDRGVFCAQLGGRNIFLIGDSIDAQFHSMLQMLLSDGSGPAQFRQGGKGFGYALWNARVCEHTAPHKPVALPLLMTWQFELHKQDTSLVPAFLSGNGTGLAPDIIIYNRGAHLTPDWLLLKEVTAVAGFVESHHPRSLLIWRNTPPGHPNCSQYSAPLNETQPLNDLPYGWGHFAAQNSAVKHRIRRRHPSVVYLDVAAPTALRPDRHASAKDCLHYAYFAPSPLETWARLLFNALTLHDALGL